MSKDGPFILGSDAAAHRALDDQINELLELCAARTHLRKISIRAKVEEECDQEGEIFTALFPQ